MIKYINDMIYYLSVLRYIPNLSEEERRLGMLAIKSTDDL